MNPNKTYTLEKKFEHISFVDDPLAVGDYEACSFVDCDFPNDDLSHLNFIECTFEGCNLSTAKITQTSFKDVRFSKCKLLDIHFDQCNHFLFDASFEHCVLSLSSFYKVKLQKIKFSNASLEEVDFTEADHSTAIFENCNLDRALFDATISGKTDFRSALNYVVDPEYDRLRKTKFSLAGISGLLQKYDIEIS
jgi:uncharacterized protein YjbI with pentapeptide repeats